MPCADNGEAAYRELNPGNPQDIAVERARRHPNPGNEQLQLDLNASRIRCDKLAALLCGVMRFMKKGPSTKLLCHDVPGLEEWWVEHQKLDLERIEAQGHDDDAGPPSTAELIRQRDNEEANSWRDLL